MKNETEELEKYMAELKSAWSESVAEIKTGNPVTDVILTQKQKEAEDSFYQKLTDGQQWFKQLQAYL